MADLPAGADVRQALEEAWRSDFGRILGVVARVLGSIEAAEDVVQSAATRALRDWPQRGIPSRPAAWLTTVSRRLALDALRRGHRQRRAAEQIAAENRAGPDWASGVPVRRDDPYDLLSEWPDERLSLIFACCHEELAVDVRRALTLNLVCGLTSGEIARSFLVAEATMAQRLVRAKRLLRLREATLAVPEPEEFASRLNDVLSVIYLLFNEGYVASRGSELIRVDLCDEAIHLARMLLNLIERSNRSDTAEPLGLLALLILTHSRRESRRDDAGLSITLDEQDRSRWKEDEAMEGLSLLERAVRQERPGPYQIKAAINALHHTANDAGDTDWEEIVALYGRLLDFEPTPIVELNRAVAIGMARGADAALQELHTTGATGELDRYLYYHLALARFLADRGEHDAARGALQRALELAGNDAEREFVSRRIESLG